MHTLKTVLILWIISAAGLRMSVKCILNTVRCHDNFELHKNQAYHPSMWRHTKNVTVWIIVLHLLPKNMHNNTYIHVLFVWQYSVPSDCHLTMYWSSLSALYAPLSKHSKKYHWFITGNFSLELYNYYFVQMNLKLFLVIDSLPLQLFHSAHLS